MADPYAGIAALIDPYAGVGAPLKTYKVTKGGRTVTVQAESESAARAAADAQRRTGSTPAWMRPVSQGAAIGIADEIDARSAQLETGITNFVGRVTGRPGAGYTGRQAYDAVMDAEKAARQQFASEHPKTNFGLELAGGLLSPAAKVGGSYIAAGRGAGAVARGAVVGGAAGAAYGAASADAGQRVQGARDGAVVGAITGGAAPVVIAGAGKGIKSAVRIANKASGGRILDPNQEALVRLSEALRKDRLTPDQITQALNEWQRVGGPSPAFLNLVGENTRGLVRGAAMSGEGRAAAVVYGNQIAGDAQETAMNRTAQLTADRRPASVVADDLKATQSELANVQYREPYQTPVQLNDDVLSVLTDEPGKAALRAARADALERRDLPRVREIDSILNADGPVLAEGYHGSPVPGLSELRPTQQGGTFDFPPVVSLSTDEAFASRWAGDGGQVYRGAFNPRAVGDFRNPKDVQSVIQFYEQRHSPLSADDIADIQHGSWRLWENADLWRQNGWKGSYVREQPGTPAANTTNVSLASGDDVLLGGIPEGYRAAPSEVSAATLDRTRIAMGERGSKLAQRGNRARAGGSFGRAEIIDSALDSVPELAPARSTYRNMQAQRDALELGKGSRQMAPDEYQRALNDAIEAGPSGQTLPDGSPIGVGGAREAAGIGLRSDMVRALGEPAENATGILNRFGTSPNMSQRLAATFGEQPAADYQQAMQNIVQQVNDARFINPNSNSQTAGRLFDSGLVDLPPLSKSGLLSAMFRKLRDGVGLTDAERGAIVQFSTQEATPGLLSSLPQQQLPNYRVVAPISGLLGGYAAGN